MTKIQKLVDELNELNINLETSFSEETYQFIQSVKEGKESKGNITENGKKILSYMKSHVKENDNGFSAKDIAEGLFVSSRSVAGSMRKLVNDDYVIKKTSESEPNRYFISEEGLLAV